MESAGISRALGLNNRGYEGVGEAIRVARELSKENLPIMSNQNSAVQMERGPCPKHIANIARNPSIPTLITDAERNSK